MKSVILLTILATISSTHLIAQSDNEVFGLKIDEGWYGLTNQGLLGYYEAKRTAEENGASYAFSPLAESQIDAELQEIGIKSGFVGFPLVDQTNLRSAKPTYFVVQKVYESVSEYKKKSPSLFKALVGYCEARFGAYDQTISNETVEAVAWNNVTYLLVVRAGQDELEVTATYARVEPW